MRSFIVLALWLLAGPPANARAKTGLDLLAEQNFSPLAGKRVGVITNHSALTYDGRHLVDLLAAAPQVRLVAIFSPEHGLYGDQQGSVASGKYEPTGTPIFSLFDSASRRPTPEALRGVDALVYDMQDVGARFYTYITTLGLMMEEAARAKIPLYVLDRPNPINGVAVEGPVLEVNHVSFVGYMRMPIRHGMTVGELARMFNGEKKIGADLHVVQMEGWRRRMWFDETGLEWINPSPAMRSLTEAIFYPGTCLLDIPGMSAGRGTDTPFQIIGAPWFKAREAADYMNSRNLPGVRFLARRFRPADSQYAGQECHGVELELLDRESFNAVLTGLELIAATLRLHPGRFDVDNYRFLRRLGSDGVAGRLKRGESGRAIYDSIEDDLAAFRKLRQKYLLYR